MEYNCFGNAMGKLLSKNKHSSNKYGTGDQTTDEDYDGSGLPLVFPPVHSDTVSCVWPVQDGICLSGSKDKSVVVSDFKKGTVSQRWSSHDKDVTKVTYGSQIDRYLSSSRDKSVMVWQHGSQSPVQKLLGHDLVVTAVTLSDDNTQVCTGSRDNSVRIWNMDTGQCVLQNTISRNLVTHAKWAKGSNLIVQSSEDKEVRIWDSRDLHVARSFPRKQYIQTWCDMSDDHNYCLSCSNGFTGHGCEITLWDLRSLDVVQEFRGHLETVCCCIFIPSSVSGDRNLIATSSNDCSVRVWDRDSKECLSILTLPGSGPLTSIAAYDDGSLCVASFNTGIHLLKLRVTSTGEVSLFKRAQF